MPHRTLKQPSSTSIPRPQSVHRFRCAVRLLRWMLFDPVVAELQMMAPAEAGTNQVSTASYSFISPSVEKRNPVKNPVDRHVEPPGGRFADRAALRSMARISKFRLDFKRECNHRSPRPSRPKAHVAEAHPVKQSQTNKFPWIRWRQINCGI